MFKKTKLYSVLLQKNAPKPLETAIFVPQGFNFFALIFSSLWAIFNRLWLVAIALFGLELFFRLFFMSEGYSLYVDLAVILLHLWFAFEANDFKVSSLENKGYILFDVTSGIDEIDAERRFFDKYMLANQLVSTAPKEVPEPSQNQQQNSSVTNSTELPSIG